MPRLTFTAPTVIEATDTDARTLRGLVIPYGVPGRTSAGTLTVNAGALAVPEDLRRVKLFREHGRTTPVGYATAAESTDAGLVMAFRVAATADGDQALVEASEGIRDAFSVEMDADDVAGGVVRAARLVAVAQVAVPAYDDARIAASEQPETDDDEPDQPDDDDTEPTDPAGEPGEDTSMTELVEAGRLPAQHTRPATTTARTISGMPAPRTFAEAAAQLAISAQHRGITATADAAEVMAALADITPAPDTNGLAGAFLRPAWLGELWTPEYAQRDFIDAIGPARALTSMTWQGWKWEDLPEVDVYAGNKAEIPTNEVSIVPATGEAQRVAGGWDVDRVFLDLGSPDFIEALFTAAIADYRRKSEDYAAAAVLAGASAATPAPTTLVEAIDVIARQLSINGASLSFMAMATDLWSDYLALTSDEVPWWLKNQATVNVAATTTDVAGIRVFVNHTLPAGTILGGDRRAVDYRETGPIRVQAVNIPNGGVDIAVFGYQGAIVQDSRAIVSATVGGGVQASPAPPAAKKASS